MIENVEKLERESADRRRTEQIVYERLWKWLLGCALLLSAGDFYLAFNRFYLSHPNGELRNAFLVCLAFLMPWIVTVGTYRQLRARLLTSNSQDLVLFVRFSCVRGVMITFIAFQLILSLCLTTR
jgi:hypothetical protein